MAWHVRFNELLTDENQNRIMEFGIKICYIVTYDKCRRMQIKSHINTICDEILM